MTLHAFCEDLARQGVQLWSEGDRLRYRAPQGVLTPAVIARLRQCKQEILAMLAANEMQSADGTFSRRRHVGATSDSPQLPPPSRRDKLSQETNVATYPVTEQLQSLDPDPDPGPPTPAPQTPLSHGQQALWFLYATAPESTSYNVAFTTRIRSRLDRTAVRRTFEMLVARHPCLRTTFSMDGERPVQTVHGYPHFGFVEVDASTWSPEELSARVAESYRRPFDLRRGPVMRVDVFSVSDDEHVLLLCVHHIVCDGWSLWVLQDEFAVLYAQQLAGIEPSLPPLDRTYAYHVRWQEEMLSGPAGERLWNYWKDALAGESPPLELPTDFPPSASANRRGASQPFRLSADLTGRLRRTARAEGVTLYMLLMAAFQTLLHRYTRQDDILVGTPTSGREQTEFAGVVGYFVNPVVVRTDLSGDPSFRQVLDRVREAVLGAMAHQDYPFPLLVERLKPLRDRDRTPLFQALLTLQRPQRPTAVSELLPGGETGARVELDGLKLEPFDMPQEEGQFDLAIELVEAAESLSGVLKYSPDLLEPATAARMVGHFRNLLEAATRHPGQRLSAMEMLADGERHQLLVEFNATSSDYPRDRCIHEVFEARAAETPEAIALTFGDHKWTYGELDARANQIAHAVRQLGVAAGTLVGLFLARSLEMVAAILGILKAGGAYVPLDTEYPREFLDFMLEDTQAPVLVTQASLAARFDGEMEYDDRDEAKRATDSEPAVKRFGNFGGRVLMLDRDAEHINRQPSTNVASETTPDDLAYVMYTSGSTGKPKGVEVPHRGVVRLVCRTNYVEIRPDDVFLQFAPLAFDASTLEIWGPLLNGAQLAIVPPGLPSLDELDRTIEHHGVTILWLTAGLFQQQVDYGLERLSGVRQLLVGGDVVSPAHAARALGQLPDCRLINGYGPTENTTFTCCHAMREPPPAGMPIPIGRPIAATTVYVLGPHGEPVWIGVPGELHAGGDGLARGYHRRPELTAERFVRNPFVPDENARLYRTGDLVRWRGDGTLDFLGRVDRQAKIHGFRIEPEEIEAVLSQHEAVGQNVVVVREDRAGQKQLVAYVVPREGSLPSIEDMRAFLKEKLPQFMVPAAVVFLPSLSLTPSGKVDRAALPSAHGERPELARPYAAPRTPTEKLLADIWAEVLSLEKVGIHDNFFDLGGASIKSLRIVAKAEEAGLQLDPELLSPHVLFEHPTIAELAALWSPG